MGPPSPVLMIKASTLPGPSTTSLRKASYKELKIRMITIIMIAITIITIRIIKINITIIVIIIAIIRSLGGVSHLGFRSDLILNGMDPQPNCCFSEAPLNP